MYSCQFCANYIESKKRIYLDEGDKYRSRFCNPIRKFVGASGNCIDFFKLSRFQFCKKEDRWLAIEVCSYKRLSGANGCKNCKQGKQLSEIRKGLSFKSRQPEKPRLVSRRKDG